jgi:hypothetical protein
MMMLPTRWTGVIRHQDDDSAIKRIVVHRGRLPKRAKIWVRLLDPRVEAAAVKYLARDPSPGPGHPPTWQRCCGCNENQGPRFPDAGKVIVDHWRGNRIFRLKSGSRLILDVPLVSARLTPVALGASLPQGTPTGAYELVLIEQDAAGRSLGAFSMELVVG